MFEAAIGFHLFSFVIKIYQQNLKKTNQVVCSVTGNIRFASQTENSNVFLFGFHRTGGLTGD